MVKPLDFVCGGSKMVIVGWCCAQRLQTLTGVKIMSERKAILQIGYTRFVTDVATAIVLEERLLELDQVVARYLDPEVHNVTPNGMLWVRQDDRTLIDIQIMDRNHTYMGDSQWYDRVIEDHNERAEDAAS
jgi:hypothetical protein